MGRTRWQSSDCARTGAAKPWAGEVFVFPTTIGQQGFWYLDQLDRGNPAYNIAVRFRLEGPLEYRRPGPGDERDRQASRIAADGDPARGRRPVQVVAPSLSDSGARGRSAATSRRRSVTREPKS